MKRESLVLRLIAAGLIGSLGLISTASKVNAAVCDGSTSALGNGGFETPLVPAGDYGVFPASQVPPWQTTDGTGQIEIWSSGFGGVPAGEGNQFAELNANTAGTLYQDVVSAPGATMSWTLLHRGRGGDDVMQVLIGDANVADVNGSSGWNFVSADLTDGVSAWGAHTGHYVVPSGQTCTRFAFRAVSTGSGDDSVGNFLDAVAFSVSTPPHPTATPGVVVTGPPTSMVGATLPEGDASPAAKILIVIVAAAAAFAVAASWRSRRRRALGR